MVEVVVKLMKQGHIIFSLTQSQHSHSRGVKGLKVTNNACIILVTTYSPF